MPRTAWNDDEQAALRGLSMLAQLIYLRVFRRRMDYRTGIAGGLGHRITATSIAEEVAFIPDPRSTKKPWVPTRGEIRAAIAELERPRPIDGDPEWRVSLLVEAGSRLDTGYVKQLPLADRGASVQKMNNPRAPQEQPTDTNPVNTPPQATPIGRLAVERNRMSDPTGQPRCRRRAAPPLEFRYLEEKRC